MESQTHFFFQEISPLRQCDLCSMVLVLPIFAVEPTKTKKDMWLPLWHRVGHSHLEPSMKSQPCCTNGKIPNDLNRSSSLLIPPVSLTTRYHLFLAVTIYTANTNGHILKYRGISMLPKWSDFFLDLIQN